MSGRIIHSIVFIRTSAEELWRALTDPEITQRYWGETRIESDWHVGAKILYRRGGEVTDEHVITAIEPPVLLAHTFRPRFGEFAAEPPSHVRIEISARGPVVRLELTHDGFPPDSKVFAACREGWPSILSSLKTLLETGEPLPDFAGGA